MESLLPQIKAHRHNYSLPFASIPIPKTTRPSSAIMLKSTQTPHITLVTRRSFKLPENGNAFVVECGKGGGPFVKELEQSTHQPQEKMNLLEEEEEEEWAEIEEKWRGNCEEGGKGIAVAELMECLEREAIMGEDQGTDPADYNRRALIFDKSSRVFQALKDNQP